MLCTDNEIGASQFRATEVYRSAANPAVSHASAMELFPIRPVIFAEFGSRTTSRLPCHHRLARGRTVVRVLPGERSSTKPPSEKRKPADERKTAERKPAERKATPNERLKSH